MYSPGISLKRLFANAEDAALTQFLEPELLELLRTVNPELASGQKLKDLALQIIDLRLVIKDEEKRETLLRLLSKEKWNELAERLELTGKVTFSDLLSAAGESKRLNAVLAFFGIETTHTSGAEIIPSVKNAEPVYGLFDHQRHVASEVVEKLQRAPRSVVLHLPTGAGKTRTAMHIVARHLTENDPSVVVWLANSRELLDQAAADFERSWHALGNRPVTLMRFWGNYDCEPDTLHDGLIIGGLQKFHVFRQKYFDQFLKLADRARLTIVDEAHIALAPTYQAVITGLSTKRKDNSLLGLTATPGRTWADIEEDRRLSELFGGEKVTMEVAGYEEPVRYLIESGYLAEPHFQLLNMKPGLTLTEADQSSLAEAFEVSDALLERLGSDPLRNLKIVQAVEELLKEHSRIIVFAPSVKSAQAISAILNAQGHSASWVSGETPAGERSQIINSFRSSKVTPMVLCNFGVLTTGFDAPRTSAAVIARPTMSLVLYSQMVGRATRGPKAGGNATAVIVTVVDPELAGFGKIELAFRNWEDVWHAQGN